MKHLCTEMCHLCRLFERDLLEVFGVLYGTRIRCPYTVHICPYLDPLGIDGHTDERSGIVRASTAENGLLALEVRCNEALGYDRIHALICLCNHARNPFHDFGFDRLALEICIVGHHHLSCVDPVCPDALRIHGEAYDGG